MQVLKFGGTSVGTAESLEKVLNIIREKNEVDRVTVVVSALGGVTNQLEAALKDAVSGGTGWQAEIEKLRRRHAGMITAFVAVHEQARLNSYLDQVVFQLIQTLAGVRLLRGSTPDVRDRILSRGEYLSSEILAAGLRSRGQAAVTLNPAELIRTDSRHGNASVDVVESNLRIRALLGELPKRTVAVIGGFIGSTAQQALTTLGRGGSDYSAALIAAALSAKGLEIWTDVDGVLSGDPRHLENTNPIPQLHYREAEQLSRLGAKVLHSKTIAPLVVAGGIPLYIRNTQRPDLPGTVISNRVSTPASFRAITLQTNLSLLDIRAEKFEDFALLLAEIFGVLAVLDKDVLHHQADSTTARLELLVDKNEAQYILNILQDNLKKSSVTASLRLIDSVSRISVLSKKANIPSEAIQENLFQNEEGVRLIIRRDNSCVSFIVDSKNEQHLLQRLHENFINKHKGSEERLGNRVNNLLQVGKAG